MRDEFSSSSASFTHAAYDEVVELHNVSFQLNINGKGIASYYAGKLVPNKGGVERKIPRTDDVMACCEPSMRFFDPIIRDFICNRYRFASRSVAVQAVAGSGKTEFLLTVSKNHSTDSSYGKRLLYVAFNKALVSEIKQKKSARQLHRLEPMTFDSLIYNAARSRYGDAMQLTDLNMHTLSQLYARYRSLPFPTKKKIIRLLAAFCQQTEHSTLQSMYPEMADWDVAHTIWKDCAEGKLHTFDGLRKLAYEQRWMHEFIDARYDMALVDEAQDFDPVMLAILLRDTTVPKVFVGDPNQQIYEWRGTVNCFEQLPENTLKLKFYSTFRMGGEGVRQISAMTRTNMIAAAGCSRDTRVHVGGAVPSVPYTYIFRTWKGLLLTAQKCAESPIWIHEYDKKIASIERLHERLQKSRLTKDEMQEYQDDDLPAFLMKLSREDLQQLKQDLASKSATRADDAVCKFSTIHSFKGMEDDCIRLYGDIDPEKEPNLYYVAMTRAKCELFVDRAQPDERRVADAARSSAVSLSSRSRTMKAPLPSTPFHLAMCEWRKQKAAELGRPAYTILYDRTITDIAVKNPQQVADLLSITGIGQQKVSSFGDEIMAMCRDNL
jgi:hypothetical protein